MTFDECHRLHRYCLLCGTENPDSFGLRFEPVSESVVTAKFTGGEKLQGYTGYLHGGVISALLDCAMVHCLSHNGIKAVTSDLKVKFRKRISVDAHLEITWELLDSRHGLSTLRSEIKEQGDIVAEAEARFLVTGDL